MHVDIGFHNYSDKTILKSPNLYSQYSVSCCYNCYNLYCVIGITMALVSVSERQKRVIIWNFMEELIENYQNAIENKLSKVFSFTDFFNFGVLSDGFSEEDKIAVIKEYAREKGYMKIKGDTVTLTKKGAREARKPIHNWDAVDPN